MHWSLSIHSLTWKFISANLGHFVFLRPFTFTWTSDVWAAQASHCWSWQVNLHPKKHKNPILDHSRAYNLQETVNGTNKKMFKIHMYIYIYIHVLYLSCYNPLFLFFGRFKPCDSHWLAMRARVPNQCVTLPHANGSDAHQAWLVVFPEVVPLRNVWQRCWDLRTVNTVAVVFFFAVVWQVLALAPLWGDPERRRKVRLDWTKEFCWNCTVKIEENHLTGLHLVEFVPWNIEEIIIKLDYEERFNWIESKTQTMILSTMKRASKHTSWGWSFIFTVPLQCSTAACMFDMIHDEYV